MPNKVSELASLITETVNNTAKEKLKSYDTTATVTRIDENGMVWVSIPGGVRETPIKRTFAVKPGDEVQVHVGGGRAWLQGNYTAPPTDDTRANAAHDIAVGAQSAAESAINDALRAHEAADSAEAEAVRASESANNAKDSASDAASSATLAMNQLGIIENVVGVLDLLAKKGEYRETTDEEVQENKWYFKRIGTDPDFEYEVVTNPEGNPSQEGWYELIGISDAVQNYVSSHLILDGSGLWLQSDGSSSKILLSDDGLFLFNASSDNPIASYGTSTIIGDKSGFHIELGLNDLNENEIGFYNGNVKVAYMNGAQLYVSNSLSFGRFIFYERSNGHFTLKLID